MVEKTTGQKEAIFQVPYFYTGGEYLYSYGEISRFFREIVENKKLYATKCKKCGKVWMPPRGHCPHCYEGTEWVPITGKGTVISCTFCYFLGATGDLLQFLDIPYVLALIHLDGTDTYLTHGIKPPEIKMGSVKTGDRVKAVFREKGKGLLSDFYFVLDKE